jgi:hypothetical protein
MVSNTFGVVDRMYSNDEEDMEDPTSYMVQCPKQGILTKTHMCCVEKSSRWLLTILWDINMKYLP